MLELEDLGIVGGMCIGVSLELENLGIVGGMCIVGAGESWDSGRDVHRWRWRILG